MTPPGDTVHNVGEDACVEIVAGIWRRVLRAKVDADSNFFSEGGDSFLALQVVVNESEALGFDAEGQEAILLAFYDQPNLAAHARMIYGLVGDSGVAAAAERSQFT